MRRVIAGIGRTLVAVGLLLLLFVAYQLWGTGILNARAQAQLEDELARLRSQVASANATPGTTRPPAPETTVPGTTRPGTTRPTTTVGALVLPPVGEGDPLGTIRIPAIGVDSVYVQGTEREDLKKGPGHYPATPLPGQRGNAAIAGHRTTYGAPFNRLDELKPGDEILVDSLLGKFRYRVTETIIVAPTQVEVVANTPNRSMLTLTTCNPKYSARQRLVVKARLDRKRSDPVATTQQPPATRPRPVPADTEALAAGLSGNPASRGPAALLAAAALLVGLLWWWGFRHWRHPLTWLAGLAPFLVALFFFYVYLERLLPAGY